ncbi:hypothetical protein CHLRE_12g515150v5 [Chlamydomonas reinhardtii]|uniref:MICOS complex subunit MIC10 n=1 Tax=Chlamydomonas reinhardtii TaxID=3055 RepID=A8JHD6_CHLRE|nr:uncharacterized protein CHLRE_12g515150v5 [Chlamydomonas reinhardtii]PNW75156.1 hypothetical protein CHLRE_12g515150v5 [Chlamydomonas reinhardtii]|eukprot:XP_001702986.1 predicted protein [Chlamydomonas reinhardtii]
MAPPNSLTKELAIDAKYDQLFETTLRRTVYGTGVAGLLSLLILRGGQSRAILTSFGAGVGFGSAWQKCSKEFDDLVPELLKTK